MKADREKQAPIFTAAWDLCLWLQRRLKEGCHDLERASARESLALLDAVVFALKGIDRAEQLILADQHLIRLRLRLRLAWQAELLTERQALYLLGLADDIGRQLGGWQKRLSRAS
jgi:hypothetical protein